MNEGAAEEAATPRFPGNGLGFYMEEAEADAA
jgi:hypothetical protein